MVEWQKKHIWGSSKELGALRDSVGQRLGVLGYGAIGRQGMLEFSHLDYGRYGLG